MSFAGSASTETLDPPVGIAPAQVTATLAADERCDMCEHPLSSHDPIARRYCLATSANALTRGCICG